MSDYKAILEEFIESLEGTLRRYPLPEGDSVRVMTEEVIQELRDRIKTLE